MIMKGFFQVKSIVSFPGAAGKGRQKKEMSLPETIMKVCGRPADGAGSAVLSGKRNIFHLFCLL